MFESAIIKCPENVWGDKPGFHEFWYTAFHTIFYLDYYMSDRSEGFNPPEPFTLGELDPAGVTPDRVYTKDELLNYLSYSRSKCKARIEGLTQESANERCEFERPALSVGELMLYTMRHVQHHAAQLYLILRQKTDSAPKWVGKVK